MMLTETEILLIRGLKLFKMETDAIVGILLSLREEEQPVELMEWMSQHEGATESDILRAMLEITGDIEK